LIEAVRFALAHKNCDEVYIVSSAHNLRAPMHEQILSKLRAINKAEVAINTIGVDPDPEGELLLRNISESNHGDFTLKSFKKQGIGRANAIPTADSRWTSWRTNLVNEKSQQLANSFKKEKMGIGSQIKIIEVMQREESRRENSWHEEWRCAQRLLAAQQDTKSPALVQDRDMVKELERKSTRTLTARVGGGFLYDTHEVTIGMEHLFEHKSAVSWTANSDTMAIGPKVPMHDAGHDRTAKLPPSSESLPLAPAQDAERTYDRPKNRAQEFRNRIASGGGGGGYGGGGGTASNWVQAGSLDRTRPPPPARRGRPSSARRIPSADRAAGGRAKSPARSKSPGPAARSKSPGQGQRRAASSKPMPKPTPVVKPRVRTTQAMPVRAEAPPSPPSPPVAGLERRWSF